MSNKYRTEMTELGEWFKGHPEAEIGNLTSKQSETMFEYLQKAVFVVNSGVTNSTEYYNASTIRMIIEDTTATRVMAVLASYHPDEIRDLGAWKRENARIVEAWWD